jgi:dihydroorotate dehydrogenase electron transfer subunit
MSKRVGQFIVTKNSKLNYNNFLIELKSDTLLEGIVPGQFVNILIDNSPETFLRRPFSIFDVDYYANKLSIVVKVAGAGSKKLTEIEEGSSVDMIYPLGNGFSLPESNGEFLLVGGGVGVAPLFLLAKQLNEKGIKPHILLGARTFEDHILIEEFKQLGDVYITTDDGSLGTKGFVVAHEIWAKKGAYGKIFCCGPEPMMKAVAVKANQLNIDCEVSLENMMACGFGVCLCCVTKTSDGNKCVCTDGPVFNTKDLKWLI